MALDLRLYALLDPAVAGGHALDDLARMVMGSATIVQLRDKRGETRAMIGAARALRAVLAPARIPLLVNDRVDVALAAQADGVHLGQDDMEAADARRLLGPAAVIGLSVKTLEEAEAVPLDVVDYVAVGGVFATASKQNPGPPIGLDGLRRIAGALRRRRADLPLCAIAGITAGNAAEVIAAGADGVAVISALSLAPDPAAAARALRAAVDAALQRRRP